METAVLIAAICIIAVEVSYFSRIMRALRRIWDKMDAKHEERLAAKNSVIDMLEQQIRELKAQLEQKNTRATPATTVKPKTWADYTRVREAALAKEEVA